MQTPSTGTPTNENTPPTLPSASTSTSITLPATTANTPPKGIVNSQQLEKELFRMFANAVMYNKSSTEIVRETVEMAKEVQTAVDNFRMAEEAGAKKAALAEEKERRMKEEEGGSVAGDASSVIGDDDTDKRMRNRKSVKKKT